MEPHESKPHLSSTDKSREESVMVSADARKMDQESMEEQKRPNKWVVVMIVAIGVFMATLDSSIVNISLPAIAAYFSVPLVVQLSGSSSRATGNLIEWCSGLGLSSQIIDDLQHIKKSVVYSGKGVAGYITLKQTGFSS